MYNILGILCVSLFLLITPELKKVGPQHYRSIFNEDIQCETMEIEDFSIHYCVALGEKPSMKIVYFFPGIFHNEKSWLYQRKNFILRQKWNENLEPFPTVVSVSVSPTYMFKQNNPDTAKFFETFMPAVERKLETKITQRIFYGKSLGAYNAFELAFFSDKYSHLKVDKLIMGCPLIPTQNPYGDFQFRDQWLRFWALQRLEKFKFSNSEDWQKSAPLLLAYDDALKTFPNTLLVGGREDEFKVLEGARKLSLILKQKKVPVILEEIDGHHCSVDIDKISEFILSK